MILSSLGSPCKCKYLWNSDNEGNCQVGSDSAIHYYKVFCYVKQPSGCKDLVDSKLMKGEQYSAEACETKGTQEYVEINVLRSIL